eukprot:TRINITY_DN1245_c0_g1_i3.p1 TRINITY_DN1245_c0_g1~~TRINITY_DN1245_c0_g1_i3.p1  ORF type:complete len:612 (-),score=36.20 TRINITY_DN1245_c0_g1_i3:52-1887(-)
MNGIRDEVVNALVSWVSDDVCFASRATRHLVFVDANALSVFLSSHDHVVLSLASDVRMIVPHLQEALSRQLLTADVSVALVGADFAPLTSGSRENAFCSYFGVVSAVSEMQPFAVGNETDAADIQWVQQIYIVCSNRDRSVVLDVILPRPLMKKFSVGDSVLVCGCPGSHADGSSFIFASTVLLLSGTPLQTVIGASQSQTNRFPHLTRESFAAFDALIMRAGCQDADVTAILPLCESFLGQLGTTDVQCLRDFASGSAGIDVFSILIAALYSDIPGHATAKAALTLSLFAREPMHVLLVGTPDADHASLIRHFGRSLPASQRFGGQIDLGRAAGNSSLFVSRGGFAVIDSMETFVKSSVVEAFCIRTLRGAKLFPSSSTTGSAPSSMWLCDRVSAAEEVLSSGSAALSGFGADALEVYRALAFSLAWNPVFSSEASALLAHIGTTLAAEEAARTVSVTGPGMPLAESVLRSLAVARARVDWCVTVETQHVVDALEIYRASSLSIQLPSGDVASRSSADQSGVAAAARNVGLKRRSLRVRAQEFLQTLDRLRDVDATVFSAAELERVALTTNLSRPDLDDVLQYLSKQGMSISVADPAAGRGAVQILHWRI